MYGCRPPPIPSILLYGPCKQILAHGPSISAGPPSLTVFCACAKGTKDHFINIPIVWFAYRLGNKYTKEVSPPFLIWWLVTPFAWHPICQEQIKIQDRIVCLTSTPYITCLFLAMAYLTCMACTTKKKQYIYVCIPKEHNVAKYLRTPSNLFSLHSNNLQNCPRPTNIFQVIC